MTIFQSVFSGIWQSGRQLSTGVEKQGELMAFPIIRKWWGLIIFAAFALAGIGTAFSFPHSVQANDRPDRPRVVFINPGATGEVFWSLVSQTMRAAAEQLDIDLVIETSERDRELMKRLALSTIQSFDKPDVLIIVNEEQAGTALLEAANADGVKVLMLLNDVVGETRQRLGEPGGRLGNWIGSLVAENRAVGRRLARALGAFAESRGLTAERRKDKSRMRPIVAVYGDMITPSAIERNGGLHDVVSNGEYGLVIEHELTADWDEEKARMLMDRVLGYYARSGSRRPVGVWAANEEMAMGAIRAMRANGMEPGVDVGIVGVNWAPEVFDAVEGGSMLVSEGGQFFAGAWAMVLLRDYFDGGGIAGKTKRVQIEMSPIFADNIAVFKKTVGHIILRGAFEEIEYARFLVGPDGDASDYDFGLDALMDAASSRLRTPD